MIGRSDRSVQIHEPEFDHRGTRAYSLVVCTTPPRTAGTTSRSREPTTRELKQRSQACHKDNAGIRLKDGRR